jgi:hypothetical protein
MKKTAIAALAALTFFQYTVRDNPYNFTDDFKQIPAAAVDVTERSFQELEESIVFTSATDAEEINEIPPIQVLELE